MALSTTFLTSAWAQSTVSVPVGANTELADGTPGAGFDDLGFSISIDNETRCRGCSAALWLTARNDIRAERANVAVRYDGLDTTRRLNVSTDDLRASYRAGETVTFRSSMNYPAYVARTEVRILDRSRRGNPVVATRADRGERDRRLGSCPSDGPDDYAYVLRTYDAAGRYDETQPLALMRTERAFPTHSMAGAPFVAAGEGEDRTRIRRIPVSGGTGHRVRHRCAPRRHGSGQRRSCSGR